MWRLPEKRLNARTSWSSTWGCRPLSRTSADVHGKAAATPTPLWSPCRAIFSPSTRDGALSCVSTLVVARPLPWSRASAGMLLCVSLTRRKSKWGHLVRSGAWPLHSVGTPLLRGHRAWLCHAQKRGAAELHGRPHAFHVAMLTAAAHATVLCGGPQTSQLASLSQNHVFVKVTGAGHQMLSSFSPFPFQSVSSRGARRCSPSFCSREEEHTSQPCPLWWAVTWMRRLQFQKWSGWIYYMSPPRRGSKRLV